MVLDGTDRQTAMCHFYFFGANTDDVSALMMGLMVCDGFLCDVMHLPAGDMVCMITEHLWPREWRQP